jgi:hypothetical protein
MSGRQLSARLALMRSRSVHPPGGAFCIDSPLAYAWTLRDGKIVHFQSLLEPEDALEAAGLLE